MRAEYFQTHLSVDECIERIRAHLGRPRLRLRWLGEGVWAGHESDKLFLGLLDRDGFDVMVGRRAVRIADPRVEGRWFDTDGRTFLRLRPYMPAWRWLLVPAGVPLMLISILLLILLPSVHIGWLTSLSAGLLATEVFAFLYVACLWREEAVFRRLARHRIRRIARVLRAAPVDKADLSSAAAALGSTRESRG